jgi:membrane protease YdiL (CAAX protease family)
MAGNVLGQMLPRTAGQIRPKVTARREPAMNIVLSVVRRSPLVSFVVLTFALCWGFGAILKGTPVLAPDGSFISGVFIAALTILAITDGRAGLKDLGRRLVRWRVAPRWYAVVFALPVVIVGTVMVLVPVFGGTPIDWTKQPGLANAAVFFVIFMLLPIGAPVCEEIGWRGFALPRLLAGRTALTASLILGVIWSLWHLPVILSDPVLRVPVPFLLAVIPLSILTTWIFLHTRASVFIAVLFHAWFDVVLLYGFAMVAPSDAALIWWLLAATKNVLAIIVVAIWGPDLIRRPSTEVQVGPAAAAEA